MSFVLSPNMNLSIPTVGQEPGPQYAFDVNSSLTLVDQHDHSPGKGVQITPAGLNINAALNFNNNPATNLSASVYNAQTSLSTLQAVYVIAPDLYYNDGNGNVIRITAGGIVNSTASTIPGESYSGGTFIWVQTQSGLPTTPANFDIGSITLRPNTAATTNGVILGPPSSIASQYNIQLPGNPSALPGTSFLTLDTLGNITAPYPVANGIPQSSLQLRPSSDTAVAGGLMQTPSSGTFSISTPGINPVTNLSGTLVTSGRPVMLTLNSDGSADPSFVASSASSQEIILFRNGTAISTFSINEGQVGAGGWGLPPSSFSVVDVVTAGTYTYSASVKIASGSVSVYYSILVAYEI
jgi:hypothetical protein